MVIRAKLNLSADDELLVREYAKSHKLKLNALIKEAVYEKLKIQGQLQNKFPAVEK